MGKEKYQRKIEELFKKSPVVSFSSVARIVNNKNYTKQLIRNLISAKKIFALTKGYYSINQDLSLTVLCLSPAYLGLQDSLTINNIWNQQTIPIIITTKKVRQGVRTIGGSNILIRRINKKYLFGIEYKKFSNFYLPYSDLEKTLIDFFYFRIPLDKDVLNTLKSKIDKEKLEKYLKLMPEKIRTKIANISFN